MSSSSQVAESWISSFCALLGHEYFAEVSEDFIEDDFNLTGLQSQVPMYKEALEMILDVEPEEDDEDDEEEEEASDDDDMLVADDGTGALAPGQSAYRRSGDARRHLRMASDLSVIESSAELLYGLIHQRYITSRPGIQQMAEKYELQHFGVCPRVHCRNCKVLPVGCSDTPGQETVKLFCPSCLDVYTPPNSRFQTVDGAFFGTTFGCLFFMTFPELDVAAPSRAADHYGLAASSSTGNSESSKRAAAYPLQPSTLNGIATRNVAPGLGAGRLYEPRIYGFRVSERSKVGPRMKWLRQRPSDVTELDEVARFGAAEDDEGVTDLEEEDEEDEEEEEEEEEEEGTGRQGGSARAVPARDREMLDAEVVVGQRKKKRPVGRRRVTGEGVSVNAAGALEGEAGRGSPMDTNGVRDGG